MTLQSSGPLSFLQIQGVFGGGYNGVQMNVIDYVTISSTGNAVDFGNLVVARYSMGAAANA